MQKNIRFLPAALFFFSAGWMGSFLFLLGLLMLAGWSVLNLNDIWRSLRKSPLFWLSVTATLYLLMHALLLDSGIELLKAGKDLKGHVLLWLYPLIGLAIYRSKISPSWLLLIAATGLSIRIISHTDWLDLQQFIRGRHGFGMAINGIGLYAGIVVMGLLVFKHKFYFSRGENAIWRTLLWWLLILINSYCLVLALSRGAWVSTIVGLLSASIIWLVYTDVKSILTQRKLIMLMSIVVFFGLVGTTASSKLVNRIGTDSQTYALVMTLDRDRIPYNSVGTRAHMAIYGYEKWRERFWFGWGLGSSEALLDMDGKLKSWRHFHNSYMQIATKLGVVGLIFYSAGLFLIISGLRRAHRNGNLPIDMYSFLISAWVMLLVWSLFDSRLVHVDERFLLLMLTAVSFRYQLPELIEHRKGRLEVDN